jgi:hypothetical protein
MDFEEEVRQIAKRRAAATVPRRPEVVQTSLKTAQGRAFKLASKSAGREAQGA